MQGRHTSDKTRAEHRGRWAAHGKHAAPPATRQAAHLRSASAPHTPGSSSTTRCPGHRPRTRTGVVVRRQEHVAGDVGHGVDLLAVAGARAGGVGVCETGRKKEPGGRRERVDRAAEAHSAADTARHQLQPQRPRMSFCRRGCPSPLLRLTLTVPGTPFPRALNRRTTPPGIQARHTGPPPSTVPGPPSALPGCALTVRLGGHTGVHVVLEANLNGGNERSGAARANAVRAQLLIGHSAELRTTMDDEGAAR